MDVYTITLKVNDTSNLLPGKIIIRIRVLDINDNCPIPNQTVFKLLPRPVLSVVPVVTMSVTDADVDMNAKVFYIVSEITYSSPLEYDTGLDIWRDVYTNFTTISFEVVAMDSGSLRLGTPIYFNLTLDNSCLVDVEFGKIAIQLVPNNDTGELFLRIPKYWVHTYDCKDYLGISNGFVRFDQLYTSSDYLPETSAVYGRLNYTGGGWVAGSNDKNQYFEVRMDEPVKFTQIHLQGRSDEPEWVTSFNVTYTDGVSGVWVPYSNDYGESIFLGNIDQTSIVTIDLQPPILGKRIRIHPNTWSGGIALRLELSGCSQTVQRFYDMTCVRCYTSYYCEGDGSMKPCGRCDPAQENGTCDRSPTEHSFGASWECKTCPKGWLCKNGYAKICPIYHYITCNDTYCPDACIPCEAGSVCEDGIKYTCPAGTYSDGNLTYCPACPDGFYQDLPGQGSCKPCPKGHFVSPMHDRCDRCKDINLYPAEDGTHCITCDNSTECPCMIIDKCFHGTACYNVGNGTYECGNCPVGYEGDGMNCQDIDECHLYSPCWNSSACINTNPGYQCLACPHGFTGTFEDALGWNITQRVFELHNQHLAPLQKQVCSDVDECAANNGGCYPLKQCINTIGSFYCGNCKSSKVWNNYIGCVLDDLCDAGMHKCDVNAECIYLNPGKYKCECRPGYAGNGMVCGLDSDNDGHPDDHLSCQEWGCRKDNCKLVPNSNQGNYDLDDLGDECDLDKDNDGILDRLDNCIFDTRKDQTDSDGDKVGDVCDNCIYKYNPFQINNDNDSMGDMCDSDIDNDGILNILDNCLYIPNSDQSDLDSDGIGDACDNCLSAYNNKQMDMNINGVGDDCDNGGDSDGDSIIDSLDNCPFFANADQSDIDGDGQGDECDGDRDGDGIINEMDNCQYLKNVLQTDLNGDTVGDDCEDDSDGDGVLDTNDTCRYNPHISKTSFIKYFTVDLDPSNKLKPVWKVKGNGGEVEQLSKTSPIPALLIGQQTYGAIKYSGTWFVKDKYAEDFIGFVFGYVSNQRFYLVMWKRRTSNIGYSWLITGIRGLAIKVVDVQFSPSSFYTTYLYDTFETSSYLWLDPNMEPWEPGLSYRWHLIHKPSLGYIRLTVYRGNTLMTDSGAIYDSTITGGRVGVFQQGTFSTLWSYLQVECLEHTELALYFDGTDDFVTLGSLSDLKMTGSFTFEAWIKLDSIGPYSNNPILCTLERDICLSANSQNITATYGNATLSVPNILTVNEWHSIVLKYDDENLVLDLFVNGSYQGSTSLLDEGLESMNISDRLVVYLGRDWEYFLKGTLDDVRIFGIAVYITKILDHIKLRSLQEQMLQMYANVEFKMEEQKNTNILHNTGILNITAELSGSPEFVEVRNFEKVYILPTSH
ncbi:hypothetical protein ACJMK2_019620 [Sinanodonta woodiana]|uniref:Uncharacterized protein n=1 Tax=Sinanodonta woodiana TaxID=1069815 RepID=A0ABD3TWE1_SINWO